MTYPAALRRFAVALALALLAAACARLPATSQSTPGPDSDAPGEPLPAEPIVVSGLRVSVPGGGDWKLARRTANVVVFARADGDAEHRWAAWVQAVRSPTPIDGYFQLARVVERLSRPRDSGRFRDDFGPVDAVDTARVRCLARASRVSDLGPAPDAESVRHVIAAQEYFCRHPTDPSVLVLVHVSERDAPQARFARLASTAREFFAGVGF